MAWAVARAALALVLVLVSHAAGASGGITTVLDDFSTLRAWSTMRDEARIKVEYAHWEMRVDRDGYRGSCMSLRFSLRASSADIWGTFDIREPFDSIGIWLQDQTRTSGLFTLGLIDADGATYVSPAMELPTDGEWHWCEFPAARFTVASWSSDRDGRLDYPVTKVIPVFSAMPQGVPVVVRLDELSITRPRPGRIELASVSIPRRASAGQDLRVSASLVPVEPMPSRDCELLLVHDGAVLDRADLPARDWTVGRAQRFGPVHLRLPGRAWPGPSQVVFHMRGAEVVGHPSGVLGSVEVQAPRPPPVSYSVRTRNGTPRIFANDRPISAAGYMYENRNSDQVKAFARAGIHLYWLECRQMGWIGPDRYDYRLIDELLSDLFHCDPQARVVLWFYVDLAGPLVGSEGDWWQAQHPEDLCQDADGKVFMRYGHQTVSFASEAWRHDAGDAVTRFVRRMERSPYADRIVGYQPCAGGSYEWMYHGGQDSQFLDYSKPTVRRFRQWLRARYGAQVTRLRAAWRQESVTFESAAMPLQAERAHCSLGSLRDPLAEAPVIDYYTFLSELTADTIDSFCGVIKRACGGRKIAGVFYGYVMEQMYGGYCTQHTGHFALGRLLSSRNVDFLMAPTSYWAREPGGTGGLMTAVGSVRLHGKLWINQADLRTHLSDKASGFGRCDTEAQTIGVMRREFAMDLAAGAPVYWYSFSAPWFGPSASLMANAGRMARIDAEANSLERPASGEGLAVVVSDSPAAYTGLATEPLRSLVYLQREALYRSGVPFDVFLDSDLGNPLMPPHKAYLFLDAIHLTDAQRRWIGAHLKQANRVLAWVWAPGVAGAELSPENASSLCGIHLAMSTEPGIVRVQPDPGYGPAYGSEGAFSPILYPDDPAAQSIGKLVSPESLAGRTGLCVKSYRSWTSVYSAAPRLSPEMIRQIARLAGIPVYSQSNDPIYIGHDYIGVHARDAGTRRIVLPEPATVTDCFTGRVLGRDVSAFAVSLDSFGTGIYRVRRPSSTDRE